MLPNGCADHVDVCRNIPCFHSVSKPASSTGKSGLHKLHDIGQDSLEKSSHCTVPQAMDQPRPA